MLKIYLEYPVSLDFLLLFLFLVNGPQALYVNPGCLKCIYGKLLHPFYTFKEKDFLYVNNLEMVFLLPLNQLIIP